MTLKIREGAAELTYPVSADFYHKLEGLYSWCISKCWTMRTTV